jgi:hypothetical protein
MYGETQVVQSLAAHKLGRIFFEMRACPGCSFRFADKGVRVGSFIYCSVACRDKHAESFGCDSVSQQQQLPALNKTEQFH